MTPSAHIPSETPSRAKRPLRRARPARRQPPPRQNALRRTARTAGLYAQGAAEAVAETLWPTRCAVCDEPGDVLCARCEAHLCHLDWWRACPRCGAPFGRVQCTECNAVMMGAASREKLSYDGCASAVVFDDAAARIVRTWKDAGERRLAGVMAKLMAPIPSPEWLAARPAVVPIPATSAARRRRGFDHGEELARATAALLGLETAPALARPRASDQRALSRRERLENMEGRFRVLPGACAPPHALVVDDVCTTGATLLAAADALRTAGSGTVRCLTFARVW